MKNLGPGQELQSMSKMELNAEETLCYPRICSLVIVRWKQNEIHLAQLSPLGTFNWAFLFPDLFPNLPAFPRRAEPQEKKEQKNKQKDCWDTSLQGLNRGGGNSQSVL